jgi:hemoglobin
MAKRYFLKSLSILLFLLISLSICLPSGISEEKDQKDTEAAAKTLYQRLGGYDAVAAVVGQLFARMIPNEQLGKYFIGLSDDSKKRVQQLTVDFVCSATGGPCIYTGRDMKTSHEGLGITDSDWEVTVNILVGILDEFKVPDLEKNELLGILSGLKPSIVEK